MPTRMLVSPMMEVADELAICKVVALSFVQ